MSSESPGRDAAEDEEKGDGRALVVREHAAEVELSAPGGKRRAQAIVPVQERRVKPSSYTTEVHTGTLFANRRKQLPAAAPTVERQAYIPVALARDRLQRAEADVRAMHARHVEIVAQLEAAHRVIEEETRQHYVSFVDELKRKARARMLEQRSALAAARRETIEERQKGDTAVASLQASVSELQMDKARLLDQLSKVRDSADRERDEEVAAATAAYAAQVEQLKKQLDAQADAAAAADAVERVGVVEDAVVAGEAEPKVRTRTHARAHTHAR